MDSVSSCTFAMLATELADGDEDELGDVEKVGIDTKEEEDDEADEEIDEEDREDGDVDACKMGARRYESFRGRSASM
jgi:hypothetical protein